MFIPVGFQPPGLCAKLESCLALLAAPHPPFSPLSEYCCRFCRVWEGLVLPTQTKTVFQAWEGDGGFLMVTQYPSRLLLLKGLSGTARVSQRCARNSVPTQVKETYNPGTNDLYPGPLRPQRLFSMRVGEAFHVLEAEFPASSEGGGNVEVQAGLYLFKGNKHKCWSLWTDPLLCMPENKGISLH